MATTIYGMPTAAQTLKYFDAFVPHFNALYAVLGSNVPAETTTAAALANTARTVLLGDGGSNYGLGNPVLEANVRSVMDAIVMASRGDNWYRRQMAAYFDTFEQAVLSSLPTEWDFYSGTATSPTDAFLLRLNAAHSGVPSTPGSAPTATAVFNASGGMPPTLSGAAPLIKFTHIGANSYDESQPSPASTAVAIPNDKNAYSLAISGTVPAGVEWVRVYRTLYGPGSAYAWVGDYAVTAGGAYPAIVITKHDGLLRTDIAPPVWMQCPILAESAGMYAMTKGTYPSAQSGLSDSRQLVVAATSFLSPENVALNTALGYAYGLGSSIQRGIFATHAVGTAAVLGSIKFTNTDDAQGFIGSVDKLQAVVTSALNAAGTVTVTYKYYDASNPFSGTLQTASGQTSGSFTGTAVGSTATWTIPAGRVIREITSVSVTGIASGTYVIGGQPPR